MVATITRENFNGNGLQQVPTFVDFTNVIIGKLTIPVHHKVSGQSGMKPNMLMKFLL